MKKLIVVCVVLYSAYALAILDWRIALFFIPFFVLFVWVIYSAIVYKAQMDELIDQVNEDQEFEVIEKDGCGYVVPKAKV